MKTFLQYLFTLLILCFVCKLNAQQKLIKNAHELYDQYAYAEAIESYKYIIQKGNGLLETYKRLADCYYYNANLENAARWYKRMWEQKKKIQTEQKDSLFLEYPLKESLEIPIEYYFRTAQSYKSLGKYKEADSLMMVLKERSIEDSRAKRYIEQPDYLNKIELQSGRFEIQNIFQNSLVLDFAPSFFKDRIVFSSSRNNKSNTKKNDWTKQPYLDLYYFIKVDSLDKNYAKLFSKEVNSRLHESTSVFNKEGTIIYFTRNNILKSKYGKDSKGVNRLRIYRSRLNDKLRWDTIEDLSFNNDEYSVAHPALGADGKKLYFASDMPGGYGMSDLYVIDIKQDGSFGTPKNLGPNINTEGRDTFPFVSQSGTLYFASDGHLGLGGLDIFTVKLEGTNKTVYNLGKPINSTADDVTFIFDENSRKGYFASNRKRGKGSDDIYSFTENIPLITKCDGSFSGIVIDEKSQNFLESADIEVRDSNNEIAHIGKTNEQGEVFVNLDCGDNVYRITVKKGRL